MTKRTVFFVSRIMTGREVRDLTNKVQALLRDGREIEANILMLRNANKSNISRIGVRTCLPLRKLG